MVSRNPWLVLLSTAFIASSAVLSLARDAHSMSAPARGTLGSDTPIQLAGKGAAPVAAPGGAAQDDRFDRFGTALDTLAKETRLPGLSAAIVQDGRLAWSRGFGWADIEKKLPARPDTPYRLASVSKPLAAILLMQLVEEGKLSLDAPMKDFLIHPWFEPGAGSWAHYPERYSAKPITVRHVLTHTSEGEAPGESYNYNGNIFADLTWVLEDVTGRSYPDLLRAKIFEPLGMKRSLPGQLVAWGQAVAREIARPYKLDGEALVAGSYPGFGLEPDVDPAPWNLSPAFRLPAATDAARRRRLGAAWSSLSSSQTAAGVVSTVEDLAKFDIALDGGRLIGEGARKTMWTPVKNRDGRDLPYALGWFVEDAGGTRTIWHYGWFPPTVSALYLKLPDRKMTLILLSNSDGLSAKLAWTARGVRASPFARLFLEHFASGS